MTTFESCGFTTPFPSALCTLRRYRNCRLITIFNYYYYYSHKRI